MESKRKRSDDSNEQPAKKGKKEFTVPSDIVRSSSTFNLSRVRARNDAKISDTKDGVIVYWMSRDQRVNDNWALLFAQELAKSRSVPVVVVFNLVTKYLGAGWRHYSFMLQGLQDVQKTLHEKYKIPFVMLDGEPGETIPKFIEENKAIVLVSDFSPLRVPLQWKADVADKIKVPFYEVDAHNIVPVWVTSEKMEWAARTIRSKVHKNIPEYLTSFPAVTENIKEWKTNINIDWKQIFEKCKESSDDKVAEVTWAKPGESEALKHLQDFLKNRFKTYESDRNDPIKNAQSNISPWLHYGNIAAHRIVLEAKEYEKKHQKSYDAFFEELVVRRELSENFCFYNKNYDSFDGFPDWAKETLNIHAKDKRDRVYNQEQFEKAQTHDQLWNAAQIEMVLNGKMHGFMRMYWAKKILEWSKSPQEALKIAIYLNDKYELDGRDPNGYVGCAWSIGGVHDQGWAERPIFGKVRYMNYEGCKRKFQVDTYIKKFCTPKNLSALLKK